MPFLQCPGAAARVAAALLLLAAGCGAPAAEREPRSVGRLRDTVPEPAPEWTRGGLDAQPRMAELRRQAPGGPEYVPATTAWRVREDAPAVPARTSGPAASPGAVVAEMAVALGWADILGEAAWEQTTRIWREEDQAVGVVLLWGLQDDAVAGRDLRVHLRRSREGWEVERVEERFHCRRKVTDDGRCA